MGRTGKLFAHEWTGVTPDIMATAKGIGGGFPLGACVATEAAAKGMVAGTHGSTYGGNPLAMAIGNAVLDVMLEDGFLDGVARRAALFTQKLSMLIDKYPDVLEEIRGEGFLRGLKCRKPAGDLVNALREEGMLTVSAGDNTVRLLPPLIVTEEELADATERLDKACARLQA
jgi:acetylornithine/N-succinyldiaminopimelate aminotransferase